MEISMPETLKKSHGLWGGFFDYGDQFGGFPVQSPEAGRGEIPKMGKGVQRFGQTRVS